MAEDAPPPSYPSWQAPIMDPDYAPSSVYDILVKNDTTFGLSRDGFDMLARVANYLGFQVFIGIFLAFSVFLFAAGEYSSMLGIYLCANPVQLYGIFVEFWVVCTQDEPAMGQEFEGLVHVGTPVLSYALTALYLKTVWRITTYLWSVLTGSAPLVHILRFWGGGASIIAWFYFVPSPWTTLRNYVTRNNLLIIALRWSGPWIQEGMYLIGAVAIKIYWGCRKLRVPIRKVASFRRQVFRGPSSFFKPEDELYYVYKPLEIGHIRLLRLSRRLPSAEIEATLIHVPLDNPPVYECISYTWGDPTKTHRIFIDNLQFEVTKTVYDILHDKASLLSTRLLWIDSISINQADVPEKTRQVMLMQEIYKTGSKTTICLGDSPDAESARRLIDELGLQLPFLDPEARKWKIMNSYMAEKGDKGDPPARWLALLRLFHSPWFERCWVVQEVAFASRIFVLYGGSYIPWVSLVAVLGSFMDHRSSEITALLTVSVDPGTVSSMPPAILNGIVMSAFRKETQDSKILELWTILTSFVMFKATDPRDKVFALQGLSDAATEKSLPIDYKKTACEVMRNVAHYFVHRKESMQALHYAGIGWDRKENQLPSWVIDWTNSHNVIVPRLTDISSDNPYRATKLNLETRCKLLSETRIEIQGKCIDEIKKAGILLNFPVHEGNLNHMKEVGPLLVNWMREAQELAAENCPDPYHNGQSIKEALWRTFIGDHSMDGRPAPLEYAGKYERVQKLYGQMEGYFEAMQDMS
jgi:hypothetical protein